MRRSSSLLAALAVAGLVLSPGLADARGGGGGSFGSRGGRTFAAPPATRTAPGTAAPMERTVTTRPAAPAAGAAATGAAPRSGFGSGLMGGLAGGLLGVGLGSLLMGNGLFGGGGMGALGFIGLLLQAALVFFLVRWLFRMFARRPEPAMAGMGRTVPVSARPAIGGSSPAIGPALEVKQQDFQAFERILQDMQAAWSARDLRKLEQVATPEMVSVFADQLSEQASRGLVNTVSDVTLEQGDLAEAWSEGGREYATVAMRFSMLDVTRDGSGRVVDGDVALRTMATEVWTFVRAVQGRWLLSAIQQTR